MQVEEDRCTILVVDDNPAKRLALVSVLEELNQIIVIAESGRDALRILLKQECAVILMDVQMPEMDGFETAALIRSRKESQSTPIIFVTAYARAELDMLHGYSDGAVDYIFTPLVPQILRAKVAVFVNLYRKTMEVRWHEQQLRESQAREHRERLAETNVRLEIETQRNRFFSLSLDLLCIAGTDGYFKRVNPAFSKVLGYSTEELLARPFLEFVHPQDRAVTLTEVENLNRGENSIEFENRYQCKDGSWRWLSWKTQAFPEEGLLYATARDITERKQIDRQLIASKDEAEQGSRAKSTFLAAMSHEIRTPMNGMLGMLELLGLTKLDAEQRATLGIVHESSKSLLRIIDDILDFSKIEAGKLDIGPEVTSIKEIIQTVKNMYAGTASSKGLLIMCSIDPTISPALMVDPLRLRQILNNFVSNALKFTKQGSIEIKAESIARTSTEESLRFSVQDTGIGISPQNQQRLFQPFSQGDGVAARQTGGTGLGLVICRRLAEMMGGAVQMHSELGQGTTMSLTLSLPIAEANTLRSTDPRARDPLTTTTRMRRMAPSVAQAEAEGTLVLLVDDHPINRTLLMRQVQTLGYAAESADDGIQALGKWQSGRFGIVITDCNMPNMDGYELARNIRRLESEQGAKRTPIIACTANALQEEAERCLAAGMDECVVKPVELKKMLEKLDRWLPIHAETASPFEAPRQPAKSGDKTIPIDLAALVTNCGIDAAGIRDTLAQFRRANDKDAAQLGRAVAIGDLEEVARVTHRIVGSCKMVGAHDLATACEHIRHASSAGPSQAVNGGMQEFEQELLRLNAYLIENHQTHDKR